VEVHEAGIGGGCVPIVQLQLPTYEGEAIEVHPGLLFVLVVIGRLDLFTFDALEKAWRSVRPPRRLLVDFHQATEVTPRALRRLCDLRQRESGTTQASFVVSSSQATLRPLFEGLEHVYDCREDAALSRVDFSPGSLGAFLSSIQPEGSGQPAAPRAAAPTAASQPVPSRGRLEIEAVGDVLVVHFLDRKILDEQNIKLIGRHLFSLVDEAECRKIILNFANVEYLSSAALGKFITLNKKLNHRTGRLVLCGISPDIVEVFEITKLHRFFNIYSDEQAALQSF
jgi:anti-sigma B factor antagonist